MQLVKNYQRSKLIVNKSESFLFHQVEVTLHHVTNILCAFAFSLFEILSID